MNTVRLHAYAKLNLTLDITGAAGGYHTLDSLVTTVDLCDRVTVKRRKDKLSRVFMHGRGEILPEENNAQRAADAFSEKFQTPGADVIIHKNIPIGAGMGGSSADIAGVIAGMGAIYDVSDMGAMKSLADTLGSDAGFLLTGGLARLRGRGEVVEPLPFTKLYFLVVFPRGGVSTPACFARFDELHSEGGARTEQAARELAAGNVGWAAKWFGNDLFDAAKTIDPSVEEAYLAAKSFSPLGVSMTGSGSAVFACFENRELCAWARSRCRGFRTAIVESVLPQKKRKFTNLFALNEETEE